MLNKRGKQLRTNGYVVACVLMGITGALLLMGWASSEAAALQPPGVEIGPDHAQQAYVGDTILYSHTLTNTGTTTDTFTLEVVSTQGWPVELVGATQPTGTLSLQVAAQITAPFQISLTVPSGATGLTDSTIVTATSQLSPTVQDSATDATTVVYHRIIFPFIAKRWPPVPYQATLNPIDNSDQDAYYTVSWLAADLAATYVLEEDDNAYFSSPTVVYDGAGTWWSVPSPGRTSGTYYYRVRGRNQWGYGVYSNVGSVTVPPFLVADTQLEVGQCTTLSWNFAGIKKLHIKYGFGYAKVGADGQGSRQICPSITTTYEATVTRQDDSQVTYKLTVNVTGSGCADPIVWYFSPTTDEVNPGERFSVFWHVECARGVWFRIGSGSEQAVVGEGFALDVAIYSDTEFKLRIKREQGDYVYAAFTVDVK